MSEQRQNDHAAARSAWRGTSARTPCPIALWCLRGATDELRGLAVETSFGYALGLELDHELVLLHLQPSLECLVAYADRIESALLAQGWQIVDETSTGRRVHDAR
jgi:hypothetical protein